MPGYDLIHRQLHDSASFRRLSEDSRNLFKYLLANKHRTSFGYYVLPDTYTAEDLQWSLERVAAAWNGIPEDMAKRDLDRRLIILPNALRFNPPINPNVVKHWRELLSSMPLSPLLDDLFRAAHLHLEKDWQRAFVNGIGNPLPNPLVNPLAEGSPNPSERVTQISTPVPDPIPSPVPIPDPTSTPGDLGGEAAPGGGAYGEWQERILASKNKAGALSEMVKALTGKTVSTARLGKMLRNNFSKDAAYMARVLWTAASRPVTGDLLNYVEAMKPAPQKHQEGGLGKGEQATQVLSSSAGDSSPLPTGGVEEARRLWREALGQLRVQVSPANFRTWLRDTTGVAFEDDVFVVGVPSMFCVEWLEQRLVPHIRNALAGLVGRPVGVRFKVREDEAGPGGEDATG